MLIWGEERLSDWRQRKAERRREREGETKQMVHQARDGGIWALV